MSGETTPTAPQAPATPDAPPAAETPAARPNPIDAARAKLAELRSKVPTQAEQAAQQQADAPPPAGPADVPTQASPDTLDADRAMMRGEAKPVAIQAEDPTLAQYLAIEQRQREQDQALRDREMQLQARIAEAEQYARAKALAAEKGPLAALEAIGVQWDDLVKAQLGTQGSVDLSPLEQQLAELRERDEARDKELQQLRQDREAAEERTRRAQLGQTLAAQQAELPALHHMAQMRGVDVVDVVTDFQLREWQHRSGATWDAEKAAWVGAKDAPLPFEEAARRVEAVQMAEWRESMTSLPPELARIAGLTQAAPIAPGNATPPPNAGQPVPASGLPGQTLTNAVASETPERLSPQTEQDFRAAARRVLEERRKR